MIRSPEIRLRSADLIGAGLEGKDEFVRRRASGGIRSGEGWRRSRNAGPLLFAMLDLPFELSLLSYEECSDATTVSVGLALINEENLTYAPSTPRDTHR